MKLQNFSIANALFEIDMLNLPDNFVVKSLLGNYQVIWCYEQSPLQRVSDILLHPKTLLIIDEKVLDCFGKDMDLDSSKIYTVVATEKAKTLEGVIAFFDFLKSKKADKGTKVVAVGGGIVQEIAAFASKCYQRGIDWVFFPTTLLAMSDSCIGGKSSLNYKGVKNQLGLFSPPMEIFININFLNSLSLRDFQSGLGEILKICILAGEEALLLYRNVIADALERNPQALKELLLLALAVKRMVVEADEFDKHERKALNYGHTIGHIIEALTDFCVPHGLAIVAGIMFANRISVMRGLLPESKAHELDDLCFNLLDYDILEKIAALEPEKIVDLLGSDKKSSNGVLQFILIKTPSVADLVKMGLKTEKDGIFGAIAITLQKITDKTKAIKLGVM